MRLRHPVAGVNLFPSRLYFNKHTIKARGLRNMHLACSQHRKQSQRKRSSLTRFPRDARTNPRVIPVKKKKIRKTCRRSHEEGWRRVTGECATRWGKQGNHAASRGALGDGEARDDRKLPGGEDRQEGKVSFVSHARNLEKKAAAGSLKTRRPRRREGGSSRYTNAMQTFLGCVQGTLKATK